MSFALRSWLRRAASRPPTTGKGRRARGRLQGSWPALLMVSASLGCGDGWVPAPFERTPSEALDAGASSGPPPGAEPDASPGAAVPLTRIVGGPCVDDAQCDDGIDCTVSFCDPETQRCTSVADDARCQDGLYCNGTERCDVRLGCGAGAPIACSDSTSCTLDSCDEATRTCLHVERDADGDGDVDGNCQPGADCDDLDPLVSSQAPELCGNGRDDNCDGSVDEAACERPQYDDCGTALRVSAPGAYSLSPAGAQLDYGASCVAAGAALRELVMLVSADAGPADVDIVARSTGGAVALASASACGEVGAELDCLSGSRLTTGENVARLKLRAVGAAAQPVYLLTDTSQPIRVDIEHLPPSVLPQNRDCAAPVALEPGEPALVDLAFGGEGVASRCGATDRGDRFYSFALSEPSDVVAYAESLDGLGQPRLSLRRGCDADAELRCHQAATATVRERALAPGEYVLAVSANGPSDVRLTLDVRPPSVAPDGDACDTAPVLPMNATRAVSFVDHVDDIAAGCAVGLVDAARELTLAEPSDILLIGRFSPGDVGLVSLLDADCSETLTCSAANATPSRASVKGLAAGSYRVLVESLLGLPATVAAVSRPPTVPALVPGADTCATALTIDPGGGVFQGNTSNAADHFSASCDFATPNPAPDQLLRLVLDEPRRVILDMRGSEFETLLDVRRGPACPGEEVEGACSVQLGGDRSFLDLDLPAGEYFIQIDGYAGAAGAWFLEVFVI